MYKVIIQMYPQIDSQFPIRTHPAHQQTAHRIRLCQILRYFVIPRNIQWSSYLSKKPKIEAIINKKEYGINRAFAFRSPSLTDFIILLFCHHFPQTSQFIVFKSYMISSYLSLVKVENDNFFLISSFMYQFALKSQALFSRLILQIYKEMGNFEQKMAEAPSLQELSKTVKHLEQTRSDSQIQITNRLTYLLSDLNVKRIMNNKTISCKSLDWSDYTFVCVQGFPAEQNEFAFLELPGEIVYFSAIMFSKEAGKMSEQQKLRYIRRSTFKQDAQRLHELIGKIKKNKIILVYHSAGNFILSMYFYYHGLSISTKLKGMIDISGGPLRYYISAQLLVPVIMSTDFQEILQNADKVHKFFIKSISKTGFDLGFKDKYQTLAFIHYIKSPDYGEMFDTTWNHPKVLKLFIHGRNDSLFDSKLLNEKVMYYTYQKELEQSYLQKLLEKYKQMYKPSSKIENLQQRFILAIPKGQHSVHHQQRNQEVIKLAVEQYLTLVHE